MRVTLGRSLAVLTLFAAASGCSTPEARPEPKFYPSLPDPPRLQLLKTFAGTDDIEKQGWFQTFVFGSKLDAEKIHLGKPYGAAFFGNKLYVCDAARSVFVVDYDARAIHMLDSDHPDVLTHPISITIASDGMKYISDSSRQLVIVYDQDDKYLTAFGKKDQWKPIGLATAGDALYVSDAKNHSIHVLDRKTGAERSTIGKMGGGQGEFYFPLALAIDDQGCLYVTDSFNFRVQKFDGSGKFVRQFGTVGNSLGQLARPRGVAVDKQGRVYVVDAAFNNVQIFDKESRLLLAFGGLGDKPGEMYFPAGVFIDYDHNSLFEDQVAPGREIDYVVAVSNQYGPNKLTFYGFLKPLANEPAELPEAPTPLREDAKPAGPAEIKPETDWVPDGKRPKNTAPAPAEQSNVSEQHPPEAPPK